MLDNRCCWYRILRPLQNRRKSPFVPLLKKGEILMIIIYQWLTPSRTCKGVSGRDQFWGFAMVLYFDLMILISLTYNDNNIPKSEFGNEEGSVEFPNRSLGMRRAQWKIAFPNRNLGMRRAQWNS